MHSREKHLQPVITTAAQISSLPHAHRRVFIRSARGQARARQSPEMRWKPIIWCVADKSGMQTGKHKDRQIWPSFLQISSITYSSQGLGFLKEEKMRGGLLSFTAGSTVLTTPLQAHATPHTFHIQSYANARQVSSFTFQCRKTDLSYSRSCL